MTAEQLHIKSLMLLTQEGTALANEVKSLRAEVAKRDATIASLRAEIQARATEEEKPAANPPTEKPAMQSAPELIDGKEG